MSINWVMLRENGDVVRLHGETIRHRAQKVSFELSVPKALQSGRPPFSYKSDSGTAYITTSRVIFLPAKPTEEFKSFHGFIADCQDSYVGSPLFGAWYWSSTVKPVSGGNVPPEIPRLDVKITFKAGGGSEFGSTFEAQKELVEHARQIRLETGQGVAIPNEQLPAYEATANDTRSSNTLRTAAPVQRSTSSGSQNPPPNEPPPGYDEAQAQNLADRLESHVRNENN